MSLRARIFLLAAITLFAYVPAITGDFVWDDHDHVSLPAIQSVEGLKLLWTTPGAVPQYYPLTYSVFWLEHQMWGENPAGYHLLTILLHITNAILVAFILLQLNIRAAWFAALCFALHPVHVESVAWISELKNTLSTFLYLMALTCYLRYQGVKFPDWVTNVRASFTQRQWYGLALAAFLLALLSKTMTASLPAALLLLQWWRKGRLTRKDWTPLLPFFFAGLCLGLWTAWIEVFLAGASGAAWSLPWIDRVALSGRAIGFYLGKLAWPHPLIFIYPRWSRESLAQSYALMAPLLALLALVLLWVYRKRLGRGPFTAYAFFIGTLFPALGFFNLYPMRYTFVADHFQYLASLGPITLLAVGLERFVLWVKEQRAWLASAVLILFFGNLALAVARESKKFLGPEVLWLDTLSKNPACAMAHNNLAGIYYARGDQQRALEHLSTAVALEPDSATYQFNMSKILKAQRGSR